MPIQKPIDSGFQFRSESRPVLGLERVQRTSEDLLLEAHHLIGFECEVQPWLAVSSQIVLRPDHWWR